MDSALAEITNRYLMIEKLATRLANSKDSSDEVAKKVYSMSSKDSYFAESMITSSNLQTLGYMKACRENWDFLPSVNRVKEEAALHYQSIQNLKELADAAMISASQYKANQQAAKNARAAEQAHEKRESIRLEKQKQREADRVRKAAEKVAQKKKRADELAQRQQAEGEAAAEADAAQNEDEEKAAAAARTRRGKGMAELGEEDRSILRHRVPGVQCEIFQADKATVKESVTEFCDGALIYGKPLILRLKRSAFKKMMEANSEFFDGVPCPKEINKLNKALTADIDSFVSDFAEKCESDPNTLKKTKALSEVSNAAIGYLNFDSIMLSSLEQAGGAVQPVGVVDSESVEDVIGNLVAGRAEQRNQQQQQDGSHEKEVKAEVDKYKNGYVVAFQRGKTFSGVVPGALPHMQIQLEGTRAMAMCSIEDAT